MVNLDPKIDIMNTNKINLRKKPTKIKLKLITMTNGSKLKVYGPTKKKLQKISGAKTVLKPFMMYNNNNKSLRKYNPPIK